MLLASTKSFLASLIVALLLLTACSKNVDSETVAYEFVRLYYIEDNLAEAAKLASGSARARLEEFAREIRTMDAKEPAADKPRVKATLLETEPASGSLVVRGHDAAVLVRLAALGVEVKIRAVPAGVAMAAGARRRYAGSPASGSRPRPVLPRRGRRSAASRPVTGSRAPA